MALAICTACIKDSIPDDLQVLATAEGLWTGMFECSVCGRFSVYTFMISTRFGKHGMSKADRIKEVLNYLRSECSEQKWKKESFEHYANHIIRWIPFVRKHSAIDRNQQEGLLFKVEVE